VEQVDSKCKVYVQVCFVVLCDLFSMFCFVRSSHSNFDKNVFYVLSLFLVLLAIIIFLIPTF
jgi:hypothetical protein